MDTLGYLFDKRELIKHSREGIKKSTLKKVLSDTGLTLTELSRYSHITPRSIQNKKDNEKLSTPVSEKVLVIAKLYARGEDVFGDKDKFRIWMDTVNLVMGNVKPKSYLDLSEGVHLIMEELIAIEHGFSA